MEFSILGPVEVTVSGRPLELSGARARAVLATLIVHANHVVAAEQLLDELWPLQPADKALASLQVRLSELRKVLRPAADSPGADRLTTRPPGYLLRVTEAELDSCRFTELTAEAADAMAEDKPAIALHRLDEALRLSRRLLAGIDAPSVRTEAGRLEELRLAALEARAEALLECGKFGDAIVELETLTAAHPLPSSRSDPALYRPDRCAPVGARSGGGGTSLARRSATCTPRPAQDPALEGGAASCSPARRPATR